VITGEGRLDATSWAGKVVGGVVGRAAAAGVPVLVVAGSVSPDLGPGPDATPVTLVLVSLVDRFGEARAMAEPEACVEVAVRDGLNEVTFEGLTMK
jgi:glycerate kinase